MKSKAQKSAELERGRELLKKSKVLVFADFMSIPAEEVRQLRRIVRSAGGQMFVLKKRLLNVLLKQEGHEYDARAHKASVGTVFSTGSLEEIAAPFFKFFKELKLEGDKILGGYDLEAKTTIDRNTVIMVGSLPSREVLLGQLVGMLAAPMRSFVFVLNEKAKKS